MNQTRAEWTVKLVRSGIITKSQESEIHAGYTVIGSDGHTYGLSADPVIKPKSDTKTSRSEIIAKCIEIACDHFKANAVECYTDTQLKCPKKQLARAAVWFHQGECGMSADEIGRSWMGKSGCLVRGKMGLKLTSRFKPEDWRMIAGLPKIGKGRNR